MAWRTRAAGAALGAVAIGAAGLAPALAAAPVDEVSDDLTAITVLNINDFHGRIEGATGLNFACTVQLEKAAAGGNYVFTSAGDNIGATPFISSSQQDTPTINFLNALGLQATAVGNHEFDRTFADLTDRVMPMADFEHLGANVYYTGTDTPALPEYYLTDVAGVRVGVIGVVTEETPTLVIPTGVNMLDFGDPVEAVNRVAERLSDGDTSNGEADILVAQYHEGAKAGTPPSTLEQQVAAGGAFSRIVNETSPLVDAIFTGHTHMSYAWDGPTSDGTRPVVQTGSYGASVGRVVLGVDTETMSVVEYASALVPAAAHADRCNDDEAFQSAKAIAEAAKVEADRIGLRPIGSVTGDITTAFIGDVRDNRAAESTLGNLTADVWLNAMNKEGRPGADIGVMNPGGLRDELLYGDDDGVVTFAEAAAVHPFANTMQVTDITGAQVVTLLEQQWQPEGAGRPFLKLGLSSNVRYTYDPDAPIGSKITGVWVDGAPIDLTATYTIASGSFLIAGGDNFTVLAEGTNMRDTGLIDTDAFIDYFLDYSPVSPSFAKNGVAVSGDLPVQAAAGDTVTFTISDTDLTSLGAPSNSSFTVYLGEEEVGSAPIEPITIEGLPNRTGQSTVSFTIPEGFGGTAPAGASDVAAPLAAPDLVRAVFVPGQAAAAPALGVLTADPVDTAITLVAEPSGTTVRLQASITPADTTPTDPPTETPDPTDPPTETPDPTQTSTPTPTDTSTSTPTGTAAPTPPKSGGLASTGADLAPLLAVVALLLVLGSGLVVATRRRRAQH